MPTVQPGLTVKSLAEVAWLVSRVGCRMIDEQVEPSSDALRGFWQNARQLQRVWDAALDEPLTSPTGVTRFQDACAQLMTTELLARVWGTILGLIDQRTGRNDLTRIATNAISGLMQIRNQMLSRLLAQPATAAAWVADLDRLRRRCDRWTDLLIGNICGRNEFFQFSFDPDRARDFAEESRDGVSGSHPVELLVEAGVRLSFLGQLPDVALESPAFEGMIQSVLGSIPAQAFHRDGSLRSQRIPNLEPVADLPARSEDVLLPGITLANLRRRFS